MVVLVWAQQLVLLQGDNALGRVAAVLLSLPDRDDSALVDAHLTLDPLQLEPVVEA